MNRNVLDLLNLNLYQQVQEKVKSIKTVHESTPNSSLEFIEHVVKTVGKNGFLDLFSTIFDFDYCPDYFSKELYLGENQDEYYGGLLYAVKINKNAKSKNINDRLTFLYGIPTDYLVFNEDKDEYIYPKELKYNKKLETRVIEYSPYELEYRDINNAACLICEIFEMETEDDGGIWYPEDILRILKETYYLSYRTSYNQPNLDSLIITKEKPENAYVSKKFTGIHKAIEYRQELFDDILGYSYTRTDMMYDCDTSDIAAFKSTPEIKAKILDYFKNNK